MTVLRLENRITHEEFREVVKSDKQLRIDLDSFQRQVQGRKCSFGGSFFRFFRLSFWHPNNLENYWFRQTISHRFWLLLEPNPGSKLLLGTSFYRTIKGCHFNIQTTLKTIDLTDIFKIWWTNKPTILTDFPIVGYRFN